ncbi:uncharacterized protein LOC128211149 isoform X2 [Mya arenaria]|uniref:uncharacterized protein LOC128211149 isoform X2 n=1 Tax=Mya arenaria TaxID=6604 RepID=UPI0022E20530|nr:uncharacterized protein LOC128211149 isoform X2 [Mya arenaria]
MATGGGSSIEEEQEHFTRIQIALSDCGIAVLKELFLQGVRAQSPPDLPNKYWTVDEFLHENKRRILGSLDKHKENILYPYRRDTDLNEWDMSLYIAVTLRVCYTTSEHRRLRHDIANLGNLRNKLCHKPDHRLSAIVYNAYVGRIRGSINRICEFLCNQTLTEFVNKTLDKYESLKHAYPNGVLNEYVKNIDTVSEDDLAIAGALEQIQQLINDTEIQIEIPVIDVLLLFRHYNHDDEEKVSKYIRQTFLTAIHQSSLQEGALEDPDRLERDEQENTDRNVDDKVVHILKELFREKRRVAYVKQSCVTLGLQVPDIGSAIALMEDIISGKMFSLFAPLEEMMRTLEGHELFDIYVTMERKTSYTFLNEIASQITSSRSLSQEMTLSVKQDDESTDAVRCIYHPSSYIERGQVINNLMSKGKSKLYQTTVDEIRRVLEIPQLEMKVFIEDISCPKSVVSSVDETLFQKSLMTWPEWALWRLKVLPLWKAFGYDFTGEFDVDSLSLECGANSSPQDSQFSSNTDDDMRKNFTSDWDYRARSSSKDLQFPSFTDANQEMENFRIRSQMTKRLATPVIRKRATAKKALIASQRSDALTLKYLGEMKLLGKDGHGEGGYISGMAVVEDRFLVAADTEKRCLRCFDMDSGTQQVGRYDSEILPWDITTIRGNRVAVTSADEVWFLRVTKKGDFLFENKIDVHKNCYGIASSGDNLIFCYEDPHHGVQLLDMKEKLIKFEINDDDEELLKWPTNLAVSPDQSTIYITDRVKHTVIAITKDGYFVDGVNVKEDLPSLTGITVDSAGRVYLCGYGTVCLMSLKTGTVTPLLGTKGGIRYPRCVAVCDKTQRLYVGSCSEAIKVFKMPK